MLTKEEKQKIKKHLLNCMEKTCSYEIMVEAAKALAELEKADQMGRVVNSDNSIHIKNYNYYKK